MTTADESWPMIEEAVLRLFEELAAKNPGEHVAIGAPLEDLGWSDIEAEYPIQACALLFRAQGRSLAHTDCLETVMLAELAALLPEPVDGIVFPSPADAYDPSSNDQRVTGIVLGPLSAEAPRRLVVPVAGPMGTVSLGVVSTSALTGTRMNTFDPATYWTRVDGPLDGPLVDASTEWSHTIAAGHRALATELVALADQALRIAVEQVSTRHQFGSPIGSFQSPRHLLAQAKADLEGARALLGEAWHAGTNSQVLPAGTDSQVAALLPAGTDSQVAALLPAGTRLAALTAKAAAGRAHRSVSDAAMQVCGAIGLTIEHDLHRYVTRGFQIDSLCGSYQQLEARLADHLFDDYAPGRALPAIVAWTD